MNKLNKTDVAKSNSIVQPFHPWMVYPIKGTNKFMPATSRTGEMMAPTHRYINGREVGVSEIEMLMENKPLSRQLTFSALAFELRRLMGPTVAVKASREYLQKGEKITYYEATPRHRCLQEHLFVAIKTRQGFVYRQTVTNHYYTAAPWPEPIPIFRTGLAYLTCTDAPTFVIINGMVKHNVGIGWIDDHTACEEDYYKYPVVE